MPLIGFAQLLSRVSNGFKRRPAGITVKVRCGPITEVPKLGAALGTDRGSGTTPFDDAALHEVRCILSSHVLTTESPHYGA